jgi:hypothetical protein
MNRLPETLFYEAQIKLTAIHLVLPSGTSRFDLEIQPNEKIIMKKT